MSDNTIFIQKVDKVINKIKNLKSQAVQQVDGIDDETENLLNDIFTSGEKLDCTWIQKLEEISPEKEQEAIEEFKQFPAEKREILIKSMELVCILGELQSCNDKDKRIYWLNILNANK